MRAPRAVILIRLLVGLVFLEEGVQKFLFPGVMGAGRFARIGIPVPEAMAPFVSVIETACGAMLVVGLLTRLATIPLLIDITAAILSTKVPILLPHDSLCLLEHGLRRAGRLRDADGSVVPARGGRWPMVARCVVAGKRSHQTIGRESAGCRRGSAFTAGPATGVAGMTEVRVTVALRN
jgi:DoxX-like protein